MNFKKYFLILLFVAQCIEIISMEQEALLLGLNVKSLKGTHGILKDYPGYEPFCGLVFAEEGVLKNLYEFSAYYNKAFAEVILKNPLAITGVFKPEVEAYFKQDLNTETQNLVRCLFNMPPGATFNLSTANNNPTTKFAPKNIGKILRLVHDADTDYIKMKEKIEEYVLGLKLIGGDGKPFEKKDFKPFVKSLVGAVEECSATNSNAIFAQNTAQGVMLGYLFCKSNTRKGLADYFEGFLETSVVLPEEEYTKDELIGYAKEKPDFKNIVSFGNFVCGRFACELYESGMPKIITMTNYVSYEGIEIRDCVESVIRNLCNIATYDQINNKVGVAMQSLHMDSTLVNYYKTHFDVLKVADKDYCQKWVGVVENIDDAAYNQVFDPSLGWSQEKVSNSFDGFIPVVDVDQSLVAKPMRIGDKTYTFYEKKVDKFTFLLVPRETGLKCCELMPLVRNVIVLMNKLFGLELFSATEDMYASGFDIKYFRKMCAKFSWNEKMDDQEWSHSILISKGLSSFNLNLMYKSHGSVIAGRRAYKTVSDLISFDGALESQKALGVSLGFSVFAESLELFDPFYYKVIYYQNLSDPKVRISSLAKIFQNVNVNNFYLKIASNMVMSFAFLDNDFYDNELNKVVKNIRQMLLLRLQDQEGLRGGICIFNMLSKLVDNKFFGSIDKGLFLELIKNNASNVWIGLLIKSCVVSGIFDTADLSHLNQHVLH